LRTPEEWAAHPQGAEVAKRPLVERERLDSAPARELPPPGTGAGPLLPAAGLRVLDLTRVIAGPVATRTLALLGADVLRLDAPGLPELPGQHADTGFGKRSALLDLTADREVFEELLATADVVVTGYRPGALDRLGLTAGALAERRPGVVVAQLSAWGAYGPWGGRRGFDSLVQVATGIAATEGSAAGRPGVLPAQALDHGTGYLLAAGVLRAVGEQVEVGGSRVVRVALARTAGWLLSGASRGDGVSSSGDVAVGGWLSERESALGRLRYALSPVVFEGGPRDWGRGPGGWGADPARWV
ncbi:CoA transferase, partial [Streptomyces griseoflavus]|uniref:CoA transferase n=1 Tax=Streptomyces griseoflavus TaxID=35619 RepID=UPI000592C8CF